MATRAFLLCGDEKAVQAVTQILDELEVSFEHSSEPAFSLKRLATQRFDLLIVDCDNAQNATQVFNSARASNQNKTSIAIAIVEGKAGVPNAFRLGASLVLTKPVSLEQARNTLRTGIGMTRKEGQDVKPTTPVPAPVASVPPSAPAISVSNPTPIVPAPVAPVRTPAVLTPVAVATPAPPVLARAPEPPKVSAPPAPVADKPAVVPRPVVPAAPTQEYKPALTNFTEPNAPVPAPAISLIRAAAASAGPPASKDFDSVFASSPAADKGTALKATNVKGIETDHENLKDVLSPTLSIVDPLAEEDALDPVKDHGVPSFGAMGKQPFAGMEKLEPSGGGNGWLIAALVVLVVAGAGCGAWLTQPSFRKLVAWEYLNTMSKIAALRGQQPTSATTPLMPAPAPAPVAPQPAAISPSPAAEGMATATENENNAAASGPAAATSDSSATNQPTSQAPADSNAQKTPSIQPAKQDTSANHPAATPSLVKASASLPAPATAKAPSSDLLEVPEDFADDQIVRRVHPTYPKQAVARKLHGTVVLQAIVNKQGKVDSLQLVSGDALLAQAAASAVKQWRYKPYSHNGEAVDFQTRVTVDFKAP
jgi:TonB family protein